MARNISGRQKARIGDVLEIPTRRGSAYAQVTHIDKTYGTLVRTVRGFYKRRPDLASVVSAPTRFHAFTDAVGGERAGRWSVIGNTPVPIEYATHPTFRWATPDARTGAWPSPDKPVWYLWDGRERRFVGALGPTERNLPEQMLLGPGSFVLRIETDDSEPDAMSAAEAERIAKESTAAIPGLSLHFQFPDEVSASRIARELERRGYRVTMNADPEWQVLAQWTPTLSGREAVALQREAEVLARKAGGALEDSAVAISMNRPASKGN